MRGFSSYKTIQKLMSFAPKVSAVAASSLLISSSVSHAANVSNEISLADSSDLSKNNIKKINQPKKDMFYVYDMHSKELIGKQNTQKEAIFLIMNDLLHSSDRCYEVYKGEYSKENKTIWFGDSWDIQQYVRENGYHEEWKKMSIYNAKRIFGGSAMFNQHPEDPEMIEVKLSADASPHQYDSDSDGIGPYYPSMR